VPPPPPEATARADQYGELDRSGCDVGSEASNAGKLLISEIADRLRKAAETARKSPHRELTRLQDTMAAIIAAITIPTAINAGSLHDGRDRLRVSFGAFPVFGNEHEPLQIRDLVAPDAARQSSSPRGSARDHLQT
jgi:hypothetical protein